MACHVDGEVAVAAHTCVIKDGPVTGRAADVLSAASTAAKLAMGFVKPGVRVYFHAVLLFLSPSYFVFFFHAAL